jgi:hypothetical protein
MRTPDLCMPLPMPDPDTIGLRGLRQWTTGSEVAKLMDFLRESLGGEDEREEKEMAEAGEFLLLAPGEERLRMPLMFLGTG